MGHFRLLLQVAFRNLFTSKINLLIGGIIFFGTLLVVVGGALMDSMDSAMSRSIIGSIAGHIQVYSDDSKDPLALYGSMSGEPDLAALDDFSQLKPFLEKHPNVRTVVPLGTSSAIITSGNTVDLTLSRLRELYKTRDDAGETPALRENIDSVKGHVRQMVELMAAQTAKSEQELGGGANKDPAEVEALARARTDGFWDTFEQDPYGALELLENRIAPQIPDGDMLELRYAGTDLDAFQRTFDRMEIVDGQAVPTGQRGMLLSKLFYEEFLKLKSALRMDHIKQQRELNQKTIATDPELQRWVKENQTQTREIIFQLDPLKTREMVARLQKLLGTQEAGLEPLLTRFFTLDDDNFDTRYAQFYAELAPLLELYRLRMGDTLTITAFTRTGYMQSANVKVYGTYQFKGLEKSAMAGALSLMDLMSFRDLYGYLTADKKAELADIQKQSGLEALNREQAEEALFGEDSGVLVAEAASTDIDDRAAFLGAEETLKRDDLLQRVYSQQEIEQGVALSAAVMLEDPEQLEQTMAELRQAAKDAGLKLRVVSWQEAAGIIGQFVLLGKLVLYFAVFIIFVVALVIINNAMMMATLQRVREVGTMRAIGAQRSFVLGMVLVETLVLGLVFGAAGSLVGSGFMAWLHSTGIPAGNEALYFFFSGPRLFPSLSASNLVAAFVIVLGVSAISTLYPAFLATRVSPLQAMQTDE